MNAQNRFTQALASSYRIEREIGRGGMATVYLAHDLKHDRQVAIKVLDPSLTRTLGGERFIREIRTVANLTHPNILPLHDSGEAGGSLFYVMPFVKGESLEARLMKEKHLPVEEALRITREIGGALAYAHAEGVIHRDVKPGNIMLEAGHAVLADFGVARALAGVKDERLTQVGSSTGSPTYMSPEQAAGDLDLDGRTDIYSLGCALFEMLAGDPPHRGPTPQAILASKLTNPVPELPVARETVPDEVESALLKALAKDPGDRFATATEFIDALEGRRRIRAPRTSRRRVRTATGIGAAVGLLIAFSFVFLLGSSPRVAFQERDWIVLAALENLTGDSVFDQSLGAALTIALQQSRYVNVFSPSQVEQTLTRMGRDGTDVLTESLALEVAVRENIAVVVVPGISQIDSVYALSIRVVDPATGGNLLSRSDRVTGRAGILSTLDGLGRQLRRDLGESKLAVARQSKPLPRVTTSSLEALKAWVAGNGPGLTPAQKAELWLRAVELDSTFAMAHSSLGFHYTFFGNDGVKADEHFDKALSLADRVTERERLLIRANASSWQGDRANAVDIYRIYLAQYPDDAVVWYSLGYSLMMLDRSDEALAAFARVVEMDSALAGAYVNVATIHVRQGRRAEAVPYYLKAFDLDPTQRLVPNLNHEFGINYVALGELALAEAAFQFMLSGTAARRAQGLRSLGLLRMYAGRYSEGISYLRQAAAAHNAMGSPVSELRDRYFLITALQTKGDSAALEPEVALAHELSRLPSVAPGWLSHWVRLFARVGRLDLAHELTDTISARMDPQNDADRAAHRSARGEISLAEGNIPEATAHFEAIAAMTIDLQHLEPLAACAMASGDLELSQRRYEQVLRNPIRGFEGQEAWVLAHYVLGKIHEEMGDTAQALNRYNQFVDLWSGADEDLRALADARKRIVDLAGPGR